MRDSYGTSGQVETPNGAKRQEAHRSPRGKRASETEINTFKSNVVQQYSLIKKRKEKTNEHSTGFRI
ncbi:hypothetical protein QUF49_06015 [Fictibacillus sp. b24]|uniref:hypothetical protein n=1 Tax=Fictibacillus sp. b24 TaxID=3055863 RepID=UPI0025A148F8|nr:hypothetical protein [Fictibacillus sp. b24]MDM5315545.1 hypothetical protein [Fictibacillus sp. b24]